MREALIEPDGSLMFSEALEDDLQPISARPVQICAPKLPRHDTLKAELASLLEHERAVVKTRRSTEDDSSL
jgi:hypothetical protein